MRLVKNPIWTTFQGEGVHTGTPSTFLRLAGCNLRCTWCDTPKSLPDYNPAAGGWTPEPLVALGTLAQPARHVFSAVEEHMRAHGTTHLVITGGEPMLQQDEFIDNLSHLREVMWDRGRTVVVTVESNCTIAPDPRLRVELASLSPKVHREDLLQGISSDTLYAFDAWISRACDMQVKLVVAGENEIDRALGIAEILRKRHRMRAQPGRRLHLFLQLEAEWLRSSGGAVAELFLRADRNARMTANDTRVSAQMHTVLKVR